MVQTILTHGHVDHAESAARFAELTGRPPARWGAATTTSATATSCGRAASRSGSWPRPGHTSDSLSFALPADHALLTGDTVLGRGTTVVAHPDGELAAYLASLERIAPSPAAARSTTILPGHGPVVPDASAMVAFYRTHRAERLEQVRAALAEGARGVEDVVERVYAACPARCGPAARLSVAAQLEYLRTVSARGA